VTKERFVPQFGRPNFKYTEITLTSLE